ncbi:25S rRNA (adenine(645)-N(1))-methyltransferase [[Candida] jaroonii]|uniref:25S rRNA (Adenine(645)-N(1))-methyltransferase n=1 Tax=[Candida] jaroonii TaxID=467808 RepID=A0ACA9Y4X6_9ASCO|nr:25S rRNA (adenine(645)-N(1))-methyltransferase [[Candida] jaroonii]
MALFEVDWDIKSKKVVFGDTNDKEKREKKKEKKEKRQKNRELKEGSHEKRKEVRDEGDEEPKKKKVKAIKDVKPSQDSTTEESQDHNIMAMAPNTKLTPLQQKMMAKLSGSRFRWINEQLYTIPSEKALKLISQQPSLFDEYHQGFRSQVQGWPENPVNVFVNQLKTRFIKPINAPGGLPGINREVVVADMGCGEAQLSLDVSKFATKQIKKGKKIVVHSFDLKKSNDRITVADIKNVPLEDESCTVVIFCLALMGTNFIDFIQEAYRILAPRGELWIAEIKSRFNEKDKDVGQEFIDAIKLQGFFHKNTDNSNKMFSRFEFFKPAKNVVEERNERLKRKKRFVEQETEIEEFKSKREKQPEGEWLLKPCIYKRR